MSPASGAIELPWHLQGKLTVATPGTWEPAELDDPSLEAQRFVAAPAGPLVIESEENGRAIRLHLFGGGELVRATGPGLPGSTSRQQFFLRRIRDSTWLGAVIDLDAPSAGVVEWSANGASVTRASGRVEVTITPTRALVSSPAGKVTLTGLREIRPAPKPLIAERPAWEARATVPHAWTAPALDASLEGFDLSHPLTLDDEHQYRRSEEPYDAQRFSATAWLNWDHDGIYLAVEVRKPELVLRAADAPPLDLDNEADDIHQDGLQIYLRYPDEATAGFVVVLDETGSLRGRSVGAKSSTSVEGAWAESDEGYIVTLALRDARIATLQPDDVLKFDLVVNEMTPERVRRLGQLVWSGDGGWTYLRGDRGSALGIIELG
jgi:hypothetical protein